MRFKYVAFNSSGERQKGVIEANDIVEAKNRLKDLVIIDIKPIKTLNISFYKASKKDISKLFLTLGLYLKSNIPIVNAIKLTKNQFDNSKIISFLDLLEKEIKEGKSFYNALNEQKIIKIPEYIINSIKVGEESGKLSIVLIEMSKFLKDEDKLFAKTKQALMYPFFIVVVAIIMISFMLTFVVPKMVKVFENLHQKLPAITQFVINSSDFIKNNYQIILVFVLFITIAFVVSYKKIKSFSYFIDSLLLKLPIIKNIIISKELGRFSYLVYILTNSGVNYITSIKLATNTIENQKIKSLFQKALNEVIEGKKLSTSLLKVGFDIDKSFLQAIALGEETSEVSEILKNISEIYFEENQNRINTLLSLFEPLLIIVIGSTIGLIVTALLLPMFKMNLLNS